MFILSKNLYASAFVVPVWLFPFAVSNELPGNALLAVVITAMAIKSGLEFFGVIKPANKKEIDLLSDEIKKLSDLPSAVTAFSVELKSLKGAVEKIDEAVLDPRRTDAELKRSKETSEILRLSQILEDLHHTPVGQQPAWWCAARDTGFQKDISDIKKLLDDLPNADKNVQSLLSQNSQMVVRLLQELIDRQKDLENTIKIKMDGE